jgi:hypothetical protein
MHVLDPARRLACVHLDAGRRRGVGGGGRSHEQSSHEQSSHEQSSHEQSSHERSAMKRGGHPPRMRCWHRSII